VGRKVQLKAPDVFRAGRIRRTAEKHSQVPDRADIALLRPWRSLADRHVFFDHAPAQRAHCLVGHGGAPV
jgi:hypothetical protein